MKIGYWLHRFFKAQGRIEDLEWNVSKVQQDLSQTLIQLAEARTDARNWREGKTNADYTIQTMQERVNTYFEEAALLRDESRVMKSELKKCGVDIESILHPKDKVIDAKVIEDAVVLITDGEKK